MSFSLRVALLGTALILLAGAWAQADTVVLTDGTELEGDVRVTHQRVTVQTEEGSLTLPAWRVIRVETGDAASASTAGPKPRPAGAKKEEGVRRPTLLEPRRARAVSRVADVLKSDISVEFDGASLLDVLTYIRELTGVNMALSRDVRLDTEPIRLRLKSVAVETVLELVLEPRGFDYTVKAGEILYVHKGVAGEPTVRVYRVTDLLLSTMDRPGAMQGGRGGAGGGLGAGRGGAAGLSPQFVGHVDGFSPQFIGGTGAAGGAAGQAGGRGQQYWTSLPIRAQNFVLLLKGACGEGTWMVPSSSGLIDVGGTAGAGGRQPGGGGAGF